MNRDEQIKTTLRKKIEIVYYFFVENHEKSLTEK